MAHCFFVYLLLIEATLAAARPPNIVFILADDLGFNDISLHGSKQVYSTILEFF